MIVKKQLQSLHAYQPGKSIEDVKKEYGLDGIAKLASNENPYGCSPKVKDALTMAECSSYAVYPDGASALLREKVAQFHGVHPDQLVFTSGLDELIQILSRALLDHETNTVMASPTFSQYRHHAVIEKAEIREIPLKDGIHDLSAMARATDEQTRIVWICNPNNPTGTYVNEQEFEQFMASIPDSALVVLDEAYYEYVSAQDYPDSIPLLDKYSNIIVMRTFSKAYGLAAFRIGYGISSADFIRQLEVVRLPFNTSGLAQTAALAALDDKEFIKTCTEQNARERARMEEFCLSRNLKHYSTETNFIYIDTGLTDSMDIFVSLIKKGFIVRPFPGAIRITIGTEEQNISLMRAMEEILLVHS